MKDRRPTRWFDPSRAEVGQVWEAWDFIGVIGEGEDVVAIVIEVREGSPRNVSIFLMLHTFEDHDYSGRTISYSEQHLRRNFKRVS